MVGKHIKQDSEIEKVIQIFILALTLFFFLALTLKQDSFLDSYQFHYQTVFEIAPKYFTQVRKLSSVIINKWAFAFISIFSAGQHNDLNENTRAKYLNYLFRGGFDRENSEYEIISTPTV